MGFVTLFLAGASASFDLWIVNKPAFPHVERLIAVTGAGWLLGLIFFFAFHMLLKDALASVTGASVWVLLLLNGHGLADAMGTSASIVALTSLAVALILLLVWSEAQWIRLGIVVVLFVFVSSGFATAVLPRSQPVIPQNITASSHGNPLHISPKSRPDIFLIVADGLIGQEGLRVRYPGRLSDQIGMLEGLGFRLPESVWSSYALSIGSIPSILDMNYPIERSGILSDSDVEELSSIVSGENALVSTFETLGYQSIFIESGWSRSRCGAEIDICFDSAFLDSGTFETVAESVIGPALVHRMGSAFTIGTQHSMEVLQEEGPGYSSSPSPQLVIAHLLIPHPPLFLDSDCSFVFDESREGFDLFKPSVSSERRKEFYLESSACALGFIGRFSETIESDDWIIVLGDHGSDSTNQLFRNPQDWTLPDTIERMSAFLAIRTNQDCVLEESMVLPMVMRSVISCLDPGFDSRLDGRIFRAVVTADSSIQFTEMNQQAVEMLRKTS